jgi:hypothetical protein
MFKILRRIFFFLNNWWNEHHRLGSLDYKRGSYYDICSRIDDGLLWAIDEFISRNGEDVFNRYRFDETELTLEIRAQIIDVLHFIHIRRVDYKKRKKKAAKPLIGLSFLEFVSTPEITAALDELQEIDEEEERDQDRVILNIINFRKHLWS